MVRSLMALVLRRVLAWLVWTDEHAKDVEIVVLRHQLQVRRRPFGRPRFRWGDRLVLGTASCHLPRETWRAFLVTPPTVLRWHRELVRRKWSRGAGRRPGRPSRLRLVSFSTDGETRSPNRVASTVQSGPAIMNQRLGREDWCASSPIGELEQPMRRTYTVIAFETSTHLLPLDRCRGNRPVSPRRSGPRDRPLKAESTSSNPGTLAAGEQGTAQKPHIAEDTLGGSALHQGRTTRMPELCRPRRPNAVGDSNPCPRIGAIGDRQGRDAGARPRQGTSNGQQPEGQLLLGVPPQAARGGARSGRTLKRPTPS